MRPTLLNFRSPYEKTPEYYEVTLTNKGETLNFRPRSLNRKHSNLPQANRFPLRGDNGITGVSQATSFVGPGRYNDQENFNKLSQRPCSSVMKVISSVPKRESGKPCYIMVGHSMQFEPAFYESMKSKRDMKKLNITNECTTSIHSSLRKENISKIKQNMTELGISNIEHSRERVSQATQQASATKLNYTFNAVKDQSFERSSMLHTPENYFSLRPGTATVKTSKTPVPMGNFVQRINTYKKGGDDIGSMTQTSAFDKSTALERSLNNFLDDQKVPISDLQKVKVKAILPKTASSYYQMRKGLLLTPTRGRDESINSLQSRAKIMNAYNEVTPILESLKQQHSQSKIRHQSRGKKREIQSTRDIPQELKQNARNLKKLDFSEIDKYMNEMLKQIY